MTIRQENILEIETGNTRSHSVENSLWKRLWTCRKADYRMNEWTQMPTTDPCHKPYESSPHPPNSLISSSWFLMGFIIVPSTSTSSKTHVSSLPNVIHAVLFSDLFSPSLFNDSAHGTAAVAHISPSHEWRCRSMPLLPFANPSSQIWLHQLSSSADTAVYWMHIWNRR